MRGVIVVGFSRGSFFRRSKATGVPFPRAPKLVQETVETIGEPIGPKNCVFPGSPFYSLGFRWTRRPFGTVLLFFPPALGKQNLAFSGFLSRHFPSSWGCAFSIRLRWRF